MQWVCVDHFESESFIYLLSQGLTVTKTNLVQSGVGDVFWSAQNQRYSLEHKTIHGVFSEMHGRLDQQLRKHQANADIVGLVIDGIATPIPGSRKSQVWHMNRTGQVFVKGRVINRPWEELQSYLFALNDLGILTYTAPTEAALALGVMSMVYNSHKTEHSTLQTHIKSRKPLWEPDPYVETLMGLSNARIGEKTAQGLLRSFGTPYKLFIKPDSTNDIRPDLWERIKLAIGRRV